MFNKQAVKRYNDTEYRDTITLCAFNVQKWSMGVVI